MILFPLLAAAAATVAPAADQARFKTCVELVDTDPQAALDNAEKWRIEGGTVLARQCQGLAYAAQARWLSAMTTFQQAAEAAQQAKDNRAATLWVQAANSALAGGEFVKARSFIDAAPDRVVWGSDWPHATASAGHQPMPDDAAQVDALARWAGDADRLRQILVTNPEQLYGFTR